MFMNTLLCMSLAMSTQLTRYNITKQNLQNTIMKLHTTMIHMPQFLIMLLHIAKSLT
jgi:hypothetical protein